MKESLKRYIADIFNSLQIGDIYFEVYECKVDTLPLETNQILLTHEFLVCCELQSSINKLQSFLGKTIHQFEHKIYWFEGERIIEDDKIEISIFEDSGNISMTDETDIDSLKTTTRLPAWLDSFIFQNLNANYSPDFKRYEYNLDLSPEENSVYLGTYFPRSYAESFCIFDNLFQNEVIKKSCLQEKEVINILTVGCGTGGDLLGLLSVLEKHLTKIESLNIYAIDGNKDALSILSRIIDKFQYQTGKRVNLESKNLVFSDISNTNIFNISVLKTVSMKFDFILSFKMICEIISSGKGACDNSYYDFVTKFVPLLSKYGVCILLDVTTKQEHSTFNPILMNRQVNTALRELKDYQTLLPLSCNLYEEKCETDCFCQKIFTVSHSKHSNDKSKVAYRIIVPKSLGSMIGKPVSDLQYKIQSDKNEMCIYTKQYKTIVDSYKLN